MTDKVLVAFLERQRDEGVALATASDRLDLTPLGPGPCQRYLADFHCTGLVRADDGDVVPADRFLFGIVSAPVPARSRPVPRLRLDRAAPRLSSQRVSALRLRRASAPGTPLVDLLYRCFEIITWNRVTMREDDALDRDACAWARRNQHRFPLDRRPLKRQRIELGVEAVPVTR